MLKKEYKLFHIALVASIFTLIAYHFGFYRFVVENFNIASFSGILLLISLVVAMIIANTFVYYLFLFLNKYVGKFLLILTFIINAVASYFVNTYHIIVDESMVGNVFNTNSEESMSFFSWQIILHIFFLGILPALFIVKVKILKPTTKQFFKTIGISIAILLVIAFANASNWLWVDKNSKYLGGLAMPWSYSVNTVLLFKHKSDKNQKEILLPKGKIKNKTKEIVVLVIGESSRRANFSLYGYSKNTNPFLSHQKNIVAYPAISAATYTIAGVKRILSYSDSKDLYEILPNYVERAGADVIWLSTNSGEPPLHIKKHYDAETLRKNCNRPDCNYDGVLLSGLKNKIEKSTSSKILVILHTSTSHGPSYNKKYPENFQKFSPVCQSVELQKCSQAELINAYDNTIVYTDFILNSIIQELEQKSDYESTMFFVSDHGESLGEKNLYMHGLPLIIAPKEQYEIPFIVWKSDNNSHKFISKKEITQGYVFHSVLDALSIQSPIYDSKQSVFQK